MSNIEQSRDRNLEARPLSESQSCWLGGIVEAGSGVFFSFAPNRENARVSSPRIVISDNNHDRISRFQRVLPGQIVHQTNQTTWRLAMKKSEKVVELAAQILPYTRTKAPMLRAFIEWHEASTTEERLAIAFQSREDAKKVIVVKEDYKELIDKPEFIAGVIDSRGVIQHSKPNPAYATKSELRVTSPNRVLLDALQEKYKGRVLHRFEYDTITWVLGYKDTAKLHALMAAYLLTGQIKETHKRSER